MIEVVAALIWDNDKFLICQRPANKARALLWEFVGGKVEQGETKEQALIRECKEELNITLNVIFNSSLHSRIKACSFVSPCSTLPPTNSQRSARALFAGLWQTKNLSLSHISAATTSTIIFLQFLNSSNIHTYRYNIQANVYYLPRSH